MKRNLNLSLVSMLFIAVFIHLVFFSFSYAQDKASQIDELIQLYYDFGQFHGTALVAENGKVIYKKGFGHANIEWNIPNKPDSKFRIGSITKQFTSMLILQLVEEGKIKPIVDKIYSFEQAAEAHQRVETEQRLGTVVISAEHNNNELPAMR